MENLKINNNELYFNKFLFLVLKLIKYPYTH